jgi:hypothetical protein
MLNIVRRRNDNTGKNQSTLGWGRLAVTLLNKDPWVALELNPHLHPSTAASVTLRSLEFLPNRKWIASPLQRPTDYRCFRK